MGAHHKETQEKGKDSEDWGWQGTWRGRVGGRGVQGPTGNPELAQKIPRASCVLDLQGPLRDVGFSDDDLAQSGATYRQESSSPNPHSSSQETPPKFQAKGLLWSPSDKKA